jgi:ATP-binding cassette subfamily G (WHITE) protein 2 (SNQ2)
VVLDEGRCIYFGSTEDARPYFQGLGFTCPSRWTTADFLTSVTDEHERNVREGWENRIPRSSTELEAAYRNSDIMKRNITDIEEFETHVEEQKRAREAASTKATKKRNYTIPFYKQVMACTDRQVKVMYGDPVSLGGKWGGILFQALVVGSLFYNLPATTAGAFPRGGE